MNNPSLSMNESPSYALDFEIDIAVGKDLEYPVAVIRSPSGEAHEVMHFPFDKSGLESYLKSLEIALLHSGGLRRQILSPEEQFVQEFGLKLFNALFVGDIRSRYDMSREQARQMGKGLRIKLRIQAPELAKLPWEFLYDPREAEYVCLSRNTPVVRYLEIPQTVQPLTVTPPIKILAIVSSPSDLPQLDVTREKQRLENALEDLQNRGLVNLVWLKGQTWRDLQREMRGGPWHILHFIGHGGFDRKADEGIIALSDEKGSAHFLDATDIGRLLADHRTLRMIVLNSCEGARGSDNDSFSSIAANLVRRGVPAVLAMQYSISDRAAIEFSRSFYEALAEGIPVDISICEARKALSLAITNTLEWGTPVLFMRSPQGIIFNLPDQQKAVYSSQNKSEVDKELTAHLEKTFTDGLAAFFVEDWERACRCFQEVIAASPGNLEAKNKLEESRRQWRYSTLYQTAQNAYKIGEVEKALAALEELTKENPNYKDAQELLKRVEKQKRLDGLYSEAKRLHQAKQWQAVIAAFSQISQIQAQFPDPDGLLESAKKELLILEQQEKLKVNYSAALQEMSGKNWQAALRILKRIQAESKGYLETERLIKRCEDEIAYINSQNVRASQKPDQTNDKNAKPGGNPQTKEPAVPPPPLTVRRKISRREMLYIIGGTTVGIGALGLGLRSLGTQASPTPTPTPTLPTAKTLAAVIGTPVAPEAVNPFGLKSGDVVDGVFFAGGFGDGYLKYAAQLEENLHPGVTVKVLTIQKIAEQMQPRIAAGSPPDVIDNSGANLINMADLVNNNQLTDLSALMNAPALDTPGKKFSETLFPTSQDSAAYNGKQLGLNIAYTVSGIWYSKPSFEGAGYKYPATWADMLALCEQIKKDGKTAPWIYQGKYPYYIWALVLIPLIWYAGGEEVFTKLDNLEPNAWTDPAVLRAVTDLYQLWDKGYIMNGTPNLTHTEAQIDWLKGKAIFIPCGNWIENEMKMVTPAGFDMVVQNVPGYGSEGKGDPVTVNAAGGETFIVPNKGKNVNGGLEYLRCLLSKASAKYFIENVSAIMPVIGGPEGARISPAVKSAVDLLNKASGKTMNLNLPYWYSQIYNDLETYTGELMTGVKNPEELCAAMQKTADAIAMNPDIKKLKRGN